MVLSHVHVLEEDALTQFPGPMGCASSSWEDTQIAQAAEQ